MVRCETVGAHKSFGTKRFRGCQMAQWTSVITVFVILEQIPFMLTHSQHA
jgi:hypothetical protein